jgi:threonine/homoserine/homoserine lactone efflux protein
MFGASTDLVADVFGAGLMWRGHTLRRPRLNERGFHRAFPYVLGLFAVGSLLLGLEIAGLARIWIIGWVAWVFLVADLPPGFRQRTRRASEWLGRAFAGLRPQTAAHPAS